MQYYVLICISRSVGQLDATRVKLHHWTVYKFTSIQFFHWEISMVNYAFTTAPFLERDRDRDRERDREREK